jgi:PAS domain S-box-containing protein
MSESSTANKNSLPDFLTSDGQLGELIRSYDWSSTPLGPISMWSQSLKTTVNLMLNSSNPIWIGWGPENTFLYNDAYIDILGVEKHDWALGKPAYVVWEEIWDVCGPLSDKVFIEGKSTNNTDVELFMKRGDFLEEKYFSFSYNPVFDETGKVGGLFCPNFDTTDKVLGARRNKTLSELAAKSLIERTIASACNTAAETMAKNLNDIPFAVFYLLDAKGETAEIIQVTGLDKAADTIFPNRIDLTDEEAAAAHPVITEVLMTGKAAITTLNAADLLPKGPAGQPVTDAIALPLTLSASNPVGIIIFGINPTRKLDDDYRTFFEMAASQVSTAIQNATANENERKRLEELAEIDKAKTAFFSNISHEFRTPLTLMLGPLEELMENYNLEENERNVVETTHRNAMRLLKLVNTLLDFSLIGSGRMKAKFIPTNITAYTANLAANFRSVIEKAGMQFVVSVEDIEVPVYIDRQMWEKIVFNLLSNAFKYTLKGTITVNLKRERNNVLLKVKDTGLGIPENELPNMFTRFHRVLNNEGRSFEGSGIGLSMIKEFVLQHKGEINVESTENEGSTFTVTIPLGKEHLPHEQIIAHETTAEDILAGHYVREADLILQNDEGKTIEVSHEAVTAKTDTVLIVDDNADMRRHLKSILEKQYNVLLAENGKEALQLIRKSNISLVLSDVMMPVMDGNTLLKELKKEPETAMIPVVLLTARAGEESRIEGFETGADDYLVKPFSAKELEARIRSQIKIANTRNHIRNEINNLFMQAPMAICMLKGENFVVEMANDNMMKLWGKDAETMLNKPLFEGLPEAKEQGFDKLLIKVYTTGEEHIEDESPFYNIKNGVEERMFIKFIYKAFHEEDGSISGIIVLAHDVTPQVTARRKIEDSEAKFKSLIHRAPMGITVLKGPDLVFDIANDAYLTIRGKKREDILGRPMAEAIPEIKDSHVEAKLKAVYETGITSSFMDMPVEIVIDGNKETRYFNSVYQPLYENDEITGVIAIVTEVTDQYYVKKLREKNEKDLQLILETMPHIAFRANPDGNVTYYNNKYFDYTGLKFEQAKDMGWKAVIHPDMLEEITESWMNAMHTGEDYSQTFMIRRAADNAYRWHMSRTVALKDEKGEITQWIGTLTDIHEQKVFSEKLEAMVNDRTEKLNRANHILALKNQELEQSNKELESFNYIASHDLQEPLRKIRTFINMIKEKGREANFDLYFSKIDSSAARMSQLINAVLTYSRLSSAGEQYEPTDLNIILQQVLVDFELTIHERNVTIESDVLPVIRAVPLQMNQLFSNLISNSLKYCTETPVIKIKSRLINSFDIADYKNEDAVRQFVEIKFTDNGIGFEKQYSEQIFKLFQRLHGKTEFSGTGIGLSICKKIVDQHEGYISAESVPGEGATFTVQLPLN